MLKVHARNLGNVVILCLQGRIVNGETAPLHDAVHFQSEVSAVILDFARVTTPIGVAGVRGKHPEVIAVAVAAQILEWVKIPDSGS